MIDRFFDHYYRRRPVTATFTGLHTFDRDLPDWSPEGLEGLAREMATLDAALATATTQVGSERGSATSVDLTQARRFLSIQLAELQSRHFQHSNPSLAVGEAVFGVASLVLRPADSMAERLESVIARLRAVPGFLDGVRRTVGAGPLPADWIARARRELEGGRILFGRGLATLLARHPELSTALRQRVEEAARLAADGLDAFERALVDLPTTPGSPAAGPRLFDRLLEDGHVEVRDRSQLLTAARRELDEQTQELTRRLSNAGFESWADAQSAMAADHPTTAGYLDAFGATWRRFRQAAIDRDLVTWPDAPIRYVPIPEHTREAAPYLYYLFYRSPPPLEAWGTYDYVVTPVDTNLPDEEQARRLESANFTAIALNHVVHHGGLGHHVQNHRAARSASRLGRVAAVDGACRIGMFGAGTLAEGWACYAVDLMEEVGALTRLEAVAQQQTRLRLLSRAIVDIEFHQGTMDAAAAAEFYRTHAGLGGEAARAEVVKNAMFPATAIMYWLGTSGLHALRAEVARRDGAGFSLRAFHDRLLACGALPVPVIRAMLLG